MATVTANDSIPIKPVSTSISKKNYRVFLETGLDGWIVVTSPDLEGLVTQGKTEDEAIKNALEAVELILEDSDNKEFSLIINSKT